MLSSIKKILGCVNIREGRTIISILTKGFIETPAGIRLITEAMEDYLPGMYRGKLVYVSGPSHAIEVAQGKLTGLISASRSGRNSIRVRELLVGRSLVVFSSLDVRGVQISAALKNVIALAFGMLDALKESSDQFGDNTESLLLAAGLNEIQVLGRALGATHPETFTSIAGVGDLDVTCRSIHGRNRRFGREIILKKLIEGCAFDRRRDRRAAGVRLHRGRGRDGEMGECPGRAEEAGPADHRRGVPDPQPRSRTADGAADNAGADHQPLEGREAVARAFCPPAWYR